MGTQGTLAQTNSVSQPKAFDWGITDERIRQTVERIVELCTPNQIIAFGSWARGEHRPDSDLDIAIILDDAPDAMERRPRYSQLDGIRMSIDMVPVTKEVHERFKSSLNSIHRVIATEGVILYERNGRR